MLRSLASAAILLTAVACGGGGGGDPVAPPAVETVTVSASSSSVIAGQTLQLQFVVKDAAGNTLTDRPVTWASSNTNIATVSAGLVTAVSVGRVTITATSEGKTGSVSINVAPRPVASVQVTAPSATMIVDEQQTLTATVRDNAGGTISGRTLTWSSDNSVVANVSAAGVVNAIAVGTANITAEVDGISGSVSVTVEPKPVATVQVVAPTTTMIVNGEQTLTAKLLDAQGGELTGRAVSWGSGNPSLATVNAGGIVTAVAAGNVTITATSEGKSGTVDINILAFAPPAIQSVTPMQVLTTATITGTGFDPIPANNVVTLAGVQAPVTAGSITQLTISVPCIPNGATPVQVSREGSQSNVFSGTVTAPKIEIAAGQAAIVPASATECVEVPGGAADSRLLVTLTNTSLLLNSTSGVRLTGMGAAAAPMQNVKATSAMAAASFDASPESSVRARQERVHFEHLERDRKEFARLMAESAAQRARGIIHPEVRVEPPVIGEARSFLFQFNSGCVTLGPTINAKAIYVGSKSVIWEDQSNTLLSTSNTDLAGYYQRLGVIFDTDQYDAVKNSFGDPLLRDAVTDGDGLLHMVFSQRLNGSGAAAYVISCDQFPKSQYPGSNYNQLFYGSVPITAGSNINSTNYPDGWFYFMARTVVHEVKHIASHSARVANGAPNYEESWLEEGTARHAEEVWIRQSLHNVGWKQNTGWGTASTNGVYCDFHPLEAACLAGDAVRRPSYGMRRHFNEIRSKLFQPWDYSPWGQATGQSGSVFYQTVWSMIRYTIDRYSSSESEFLTALNNATTTGVNNIVARAGVGIDQILVNWGLALYADDYPGMPANPDYQFPTWNLRSIYAGLNESPSWRGTFPNPFPIIPTAAAFGNFQTDPVNIRGGAHAYYEISGNGAQSQMLKLRSSAGGVPPSTVIFAVLRLK